MSGLREYLLRLVAAGLLCAGVTALCPKGKQELLRICCACVLALTALSPLAGGSWTLPERSYETQVRQAADEALARAREARRQQVELSLAHDAQELAANAGLIVTARVSCAERADGSLAVSGLWLRGRQRPGAAGADRGRPLPHRRHRRQHRHRQNEIGGNNMKKRGAIYSVVALMLCVAVYLNWSYSKTEDGEPQREAGGKILGESVLVDGTDGAASPDWPVAAAAGDDYFSEARLSRQKARDESVAILNKTVSSESAGEEARAAASADIQVMAENATTESRIENLVMAKGYRDCVVFINKNGVNVIIAKLENGLTDADVAKIRDIVLDEADVAADQIKIIETA